MDHSKNPPGYGQVIQN